jgi:hypothetical protein
MGMEATDTLLGVVFTKPPTFSAGVVAGPITGVLFASPPEFPSGSLYGTLFYQGWGSPIGIT